MSPEMMQVGKSATPPNTSHAINKMNDKFNFESCNDFEALSERSSYGRQTDIWSLGITLVEMAQGKAPFRNAAAAIYSVCVMKDYPSFPDEMSDDAKDFLSRCTSDASVN